MAFLKVENLVKVYGSMEAQRKVLDNISFELEKSDICVIKGQSGSGKTTLLNIIGAIERDDEGVVTIDGKSTKGMSEKALTGYRRDNLGYVFQQYNLVPNLTAYENICVGQYLSNKPLDIDMLVDKVGLEKHKNKLPNQLSGGQQQRVSIARALVKNPQLVLLDEPTGALDYKTSKEILELIEQINRDYRTTMIIVTHNEEITKMADRVIEIKDGTVIRNFVNENRVPVRDIRW